MSHQLLVEDSVVPALIAGADSHTTMAGVLGAFAAGLVTDILGLLATGRLGCDCPKRFADLFGTLGDGVSGKDAALKMMSFGGGAPDIQPLNFWTTILGHSRTGAR